MYSFPSPTAGLGARWVLVCRGTVRQHPARYEVDLLKVGRRTRTKRHVPAVRNTARYRHFGRAVDF
jgi:hypothetical protein